MMSNHATQTRIHLVDRSFRPINCIAIAFALALNTFDRYSLKYFSFSLVRPNTRDIEKLVPLCLSKSREYK
jgi:hypothetical protein